MTKKKMAKRIIVTMVAAIFALSLAGCGSSETKTTAAPQTTEAQTEKSEAADPLSFVKSGEIYFDNQLGSSVTISVDGQKLAGNTTAAKKGLSVTVDGLDPDGEISYVLVYTKKGDTADRSAAIVASGLDNSRVSSSLTKTLNFEMDKACVCLFKTGEKWNQNLSEGMNTLIKKYLPEGMGDN
jgi:FlaG/FlaF family flagellin (archaellin)